MKRILLGAGVCLAMQMSFGSGFALYQPSAVTHAMGGALVGKAMDAAANFNNPATLTDLTNMQVSVGFVTEHPRGRVRIGSSKLGHETWKMDPGMFWLPHFQLAVPLPYDFTFGLGFGADYGLGTKYSGSSPVNWSAYETTIQGLVLNPNLAYKITDKWSIAAGMRWLYFDFEQYSAPQVPNSGIELGRFTNHLKGDNDFRDLGWQIGTKYDITETLSVGLVYKSWIDVGVRGRTRTTVRSWNSKGISTLAHGAADQGIAQAMRAQGVPESQIPTQLAMMKQYQPSVYESYVSQADATIRNTVANSAREHTGRAGADITIPQSITGGINWDVFPTWHLGAAVSWTEWSEFDNLHFDLEGGDKDTHLGWNDTWRFSVGSCWDFAEDWKWMISYTYDMDSTASDQASVMLPPADRHILATGFAWNCWRGLEFALSYACIFMDGGRMHVNDAFGDRYSLETKEGFCHAAGFSVTYRF